MFMYSRRSSRRCQGSGPGTYQARVAARKMDAENEVIKPFNENAERSIAIHQVYDAWKRSNCVIA